MSILPRKTKLNQEENFEEDLMSKVMDKRTARKTTVKSANNSFAVQQQRKSIATNILNDEILIEKNLVYQGNINSVENEMDAFKKRLDLHLENFRSDAVNDLIFIKRNIMTEQKTMIDVEKRKTMELGSVKANQIDTLKYSLQQANSEIDKCDMIKEIMAQYIWQLKNQMKEEKMKSTILKQGMQVEVFENRREKLIFETIKKYKKKRIFRKLYKNMHINKTDKLKIKLEEEYNAHLEEMKNNYENQILLLTTKVSELSLENQKLIESRIIMQESMKKALVRGVNALNTEAINFLDDDQTLILNFNSNDNYMPLKTMEVSQTIIANKKNNNISQILPTDTSNLINFKQEKQDKEKETKIINNLSSISHKINNNNAGLQKNNNQSSISNTNTHAHISHNNANGNNFINETKVISKTPETKQLKAISIIPREEIKNEKQLNKELTWISAWPENEDLTYEMQEIGKSMADQTKLITNRLSPNLTAVPMPMINRQKRDTNVLPEDGDDFYNLNHNVQAGNNGSFFIDLSNNSKIFLISV
jgi:hypothetical protein